MAECGVSPLKEIEGKIAFYLRTGGGGVEGVFRSI